MKVYVVKAMSESKTWNVRSFLSASLAHDFAAHLQVLANHYHDLYWICKKGNVKFEMSPFRAGEEYDPKYQTEFSVGKLDLCVMPSYL